MTYEDSNAGIIRDLAQENASPEVLAPGVIYGYMTPDGPKLVDLTGDEYHELPRRKNGTVHVTDVASFAQYYEKHSDRGSEVFADTDRANIVAVLDAHGNGLDGETAGNDGARWQEHRLSLKLSTTPEWLTWTTANRVMMPQSQFAEFIEDHIGDIAPDGPCTGADLLEMAQQFQAHTKVEFRSGSRLASGETQFTYNETISASAGTKNGLITIPGAFELGIRVFDDSDPYRVKARFRYRMNDGALQLGYHLDDPERKYRDAVTQVVEKAEAATGVTIMRGRPS